MSCAISSRSAVSTSLFSPRFVSTLMKRFRVFLFFPRFVSSATLSRQSEERVSANRSAIDLSPSKDLQRRSSIKSVATTCPRLDHRREKFEEFSSAENFERPSVRSLLVCDDNFSTKIDAEFDANLERARQLRVGRNGEREREREVRRERWRSVRTGKGREDGLAE